MVVLGLLLLLRIINIVAQLRFQNTILIINIVAQLRCEKVTEDQRGRASKNHHQDYHQYCLDYQYHHPDNQHRGTITL